MSVLIAVTIFCFVGSSILPALLLRCPKENTAYYISLVVSESHYQVLQASENNAHELLFNYVAQDLSCLPDLFEQYVSQRMDTSNFSILDVRISLSSPTGFSDGTLKIKVSISVAGRIWLYSNIMNFSQSSTDVSKRLSFKHPGLCQDNQSNPWRVDQQ